MLSGTPVCRGVQAVFQLAWVAEAGMFDQPCAPPAHVYGGYLITAIIKAP